MQAAKIRAQGGSAQAVSCNVLDSAQQADALDKHLEVYGTVEAVCLNAGIFESGKYHHAAAVAWFESAIMTTH